MSTIAEEIARLKSAKTDIATAIENKGVTVPEGTKLDGYAALVDEISGGGGDDALASFIESCPTVLTNSKVTKVRNYGFLDCGTLESADFPACSYIGMSAFASCYSLQSMKLESCTYVENYAFNSCYRLSDVSLPVCTYIGSYAFQSCFKLGSIDLPQCKTVHWSAFYSCSGLLSISLPACTYIASLAFRECVKLPSISLPVCTTIQGSAFYKCSALSEVYIGTSNCTLGNSSAFSSTPIASGTGSIYVPSEYVDAYRSSAVWSLYSSQIFGYDFANGTPV